LSFRIGILGVERCEKKTCGVELSPGMVEVLEEVGDDGSGSSRVGIGIGICTDGAEGATPSVFFGEWWIPEEEKG